MFVLGFGIFVVIIGGFVFVIFFYFGWVFKIIKEINDEYEKCKSIVLIVIYVYFEKYFVELINKMVDEVLRYFFWCIEGIEIRNRMVWEECEKIVVNCYLFSKLVREVSFLKKFVILLRRKLELLKVEDMKVLLYLVYDYLLC